MKFFIMKFFKPPEDEPVQQLRGAPPGGLTVSGPSRCCSSWAAGGPDCPPRCRSSGSPSWPAPSASLLSNTQTPGHLQVESKEDHGLSLS
ncbi:hypothetical protein EYF80_064311 [Liparis tanakae]|uniref:Uncharacterized protein n=1 Tax=Liparis tanakae TaxID=230148 RepID=A0A4Z2E9R7_9TELE|nr:hypothetical protein EYF80_064311 [Liparis tanakae]